MKNVLEPLTSHSDYCIVTRSYEEYHSLILNYITYRISHKYEAEDLAQDVFVRLLEYKLMLREDTVKYFLFSIARNLVTDYIRRYYKKQEVTSYIYDSLSHATNDVEEHCHVKVLEELERKQLSTFSAQRKKIYHLSRFEEKTVGEISEELQLSKRTVENHLLMGRKIMRNYIRRCI